MGFSSLPHGTVITKSYVEMAQSWLDLVQKDMPRNDLIRRRELLLSSGFSLCSEEVFQIYRMHEWQKGARVTAVNGLKIHQLIHSQNIY